MCSSCVVTADIAELMTRIVDSMKLFMMHNICSQGECCDPEGVAETRDVRLR